MDKDDKQKAQIDRAYQKLEGLYVRRNSVRNWMLIANTTIFIGIMSLFNIETSVLLSCVVSIVLSILGIIITWQLHSLMRKYSTLAEQIRDYIKKEESDGVQIFINTHHKALKGFGAIETWISCAIGTTYFLIIGITIGMTISKMSIICANQFFFIGYSSL